jgi:hypothetical protein
MKKCFIYALALALLCFSSNLFSQDVLSTKANTRDNPVKKYLRPSLTILYLNRGDERSKRMEKIVLDYPVPGKFNNNNVPVRSISINPDIKSIDQTLTKDISRQIIAKWFDRNTKGDFDMNLIGERGLYNASDADVIRAKASERKMSLLKDAGENLLDRSYILVYDIKNIQTIDEYEAKTRQPNTGEEGYIADFDCYVYRLDWNDSIAAIFYNNLWVDSSNYNADKVAAFEKTTFPVKFVGKTSNPFGVIECSQYKDHSKNIFGSRSDNQLFADLFPKIVNLNDVSLAKINEDFRVKIPIYSTHPITAKAGLKEGLSVDKRFFAYEFELDSKGNKIANRKGVVRASNKIVDDRKIATGEGGTSTFYQVAGRKLEEGMLLQEKQDWGIGFSLGYGINPGIVGEGINALLEINASLWAGKSGALLPPGIKIYVSGSYASSIKDSLGTYEYTVASAVGGLSKDFNFLHHFVLVPFAGYGIESLVNNNSDYSKDAYQSSFIQFGARLGMNLNYNFQILGSFQYNAIMQATLLNPDNGLNIDNSYYFQHNRGGSQMTIGLRYQF